MKKEITIEGWCEYDPAEERSVGLCDDERRKNCENNSAIRCDSFNTCKKYQVTIISKEIDFKKPSPVHLQPQGRFRRIQIDKKEHTNRRKKKESSSHCNNSISMKELKESEDKMVEAFKAWIKCPSPFRVMIQHLNKPK